MCLIANFHVATGKVVSSTLGPTRTKADIATHIKATLDTEALAGWIFVADQLNTHCSASLVEWVAKRCGYAGALGVKGKPGRLKSLSTRRAFLSDPARRIRFVYTPRHCSWLNQVEF